MSKSTEFMKELGTRSLDVLREIENNYLKKNFHQKEMTCKDCSIDGDCETCNRAWQAKFIFEDGKTIDYKTEFWNDIFIYGMFVERIDENHISLVIVTGNGKLTSISDRAEDLSVHSGYEVIYYKDEAEFQKLTKDQKAKVMAALI